jgi:thiamine biosynthesis protein ThiS
VGCPIIEIVSTEAATIEITVNGQVTTTARGGTVLDLLQAIGIKPDRVAVELNREIVKQRDWPSTMVDAGAQVEIVHFVGGG